MKKILIIGMISCSLMAQETFSSYQVKENGKKIAIKAKKSGKFKKDHITKDGKKFSKYANIIIKFNKNIDIEEFSKKYQLSLKHKMITGHYIFINKSSVPSMEIIKEIIDSDDTISTAMPNWKLNQKMQ